MEKWTEKLVWNRAVTFSTLESNVGPYAQDTTRNAETLDTSGSAKEGDFTRFGDFFEVDVHQDPAVTRDLIQAKKAAVIRTLGSQVLNGTTTPPDLVGFDGHIVSAQKHQVTGNVPTLGDWELLASLVTASDGLVGSGPDCFVCHGQIWRHLIKLIRTAGMTPKFIHDEELRVPVLHYLGIPVFVGQNSQTETDTTQSIWAVKIKGSTGVKLCHLEGQSADFGIRVEDLDRYTSSKSHRAKFVGGFYALLVPEDESIARMWDISTLDNTLAITSQT